MEKFFSKTTMVRCKTNQKDFKKFYSNMKDTKENFNLLRRKKSQKRLYV